MRTLRRFIDRSPGNRLEKLKGRRAGQHSIRINTDALRSWAPERSRFVFVFLGRYRWAYSICPPLSSWLSLRRLLHQGRCLPSKERCSG